MLQRRRKKNKFDYSNKKYKNPFFRKKSKIKIKLFKFPGGGKLFFILLLLIIFLFVWFFCFSKFFNIKNVEIRGLSKISNREIEDIVSEQINNKRLFILPQKNLFLFNKKLLKNSLNSKYCFSNLVIDKKLPNSLFIDVKEKSYTYIFNYDEKYYYIDSEGYIINEVNPLDITEKKYPLISYQGKSSIISYNNMKYDKVEIDDEYFIYIKNLFDEFLPLKDLISERFIIDDEINTVKVLIQGGPMIYFNINEDVNKQIKKLLVTKNEKLKDEFNKKDYIDLRYGDMIYYR